MACEGGSIFFSCKGERVVSTWQMVVILGFTTLALFVDGLLRMLGIIPPFMHIDINILERIETDIIDKIKQVPIQKIFQNNFR